MGALGDDEIHELGEQVTSIDCLVLRGGILAMRPLIVSTTADLPGGTFQPSNGQQ